MPRASAAQLDEPAASPTLEASSAPRTETTTAAPASVRSSRQEVTLHQSPAVAQPTSSQSVSPHNPSCKEKKKNDIHSLVNVLKCISFPFCASIKLLLTYSCTFGCYISWACIQLILTFTFNFLPHFLFCRMVVWRLWSVQPERHILPCLLQRGSLQ